MLDAQSANVEDPFPSCYSVQLPTPMPVKPRDTESVKTFVNACTKPSHASNAPTDVQRPANGSTQKSA